VRSGFYKHPSAEPFGDRLYVLHNCFVQGKQARVKTQICVIRLTQLYCKNANLRHPSSIC